MIEPSRLLENVATSMKPLTKKFGDHLMRKKAQNAFLRLILSAAFTLSSGNVLAETADWLAVDLNMTDRTESLFQVRQESIKSFQDRNVAQAASVIQNLRSIMNSSHSEDSNNFVDALVSEQKTSAEIWLKKIPRAKQSSDSESLRPVNQHVQCYMNRDESLIECNDAKKSSIHTATADRAPTDAFYGKSIVAQVALEGLASQQLLQPKEIKSPMAPSSEPEVVVLKPRHDGLVVAVGGSINFEFENESKKVSLDASLKNIGLTIFVRDTTIVDWDADAFRLIGRKSGRTEVFVVTPGRISIIEANVKDSLSKPSPLMVQNSVATSDAPKMEIPTTLASLDGLDRAATAGGLAANHGGLSTLAPDLAVTDELSKVGEPGLNAGAQFVRAKSKANFDTMRLKVIDDRSQQGQNYPVSGVRVKIIGTNFNELTNARGEVDVLDVPMGSRLLVDISDDRGYLMPQVSEIVADRDGASRAIPQSIVARRFASLDLAARSGGVIQDMQKSSLCGTAVRNDVAIGGVSISLDVQAVGPFYFNHLGFVDLRLGATSPNGRFCFFNVEPGPVTIGFKTNGNDPLSVVAGFVSGRHLEEIFNLADARHVSSTISTIASANEQLGSDPVRANRYDVVDSADVYAVGSGELMIPVEDGVMTTASNVLPFKGRVWTVSASSDFETSVQGISTHAPNTKQILTLVPNGFVNDMSYFAQTIHNNDGGSVVVEHGNLGGHGDQSVKMRLIDAYGNDAGDGWYFADQPVAKAIFFNVPAGIYAVLIETQSGHWISADTVVVYSDSVSMVKTGSQVERLSKPRPKPSLD